MVDEQGGRGDTDLVGADHRDTDELAEVDGAHRQQCADHRSTGLAPPILPAAKPNEEADADSRVADLVLGRADYRAVDTSGDQSRDDGGH
ncbi:hypothetical protein [Streptomyces scabiei]|uniref:hypothetical protein n=1 Tax=Streptomyces scabiei TaxID=1930 RepID=UPI002FF0B3F0